MAVFSGNGSAASPSFTFSSDTDLGIYRGDADTLSFSTGGIERVSITSTGVSEFKNNLSVNTDTSDATSSYVVLTTAGQFELGKNYNTTSVDFLNKVIMGSGGITMEVDRSTNPTNTTPSTGAGSFYASKTNIYLTAGGLNNNNAFQRPAATESGTNFSDDWVNTITNNELTHYSFFAKSECAREQRTAGASRRVTSAGFGAWAPSATTCPYNWTGFELVNAGFENVNITGFKSNVAIKTGATNYSFYASGDAPNYFEGTIQSPGTYNNSNTNTNNPLRCTSQGIFQRITSSRRYKDNIRDCPGFGSGSALDFLSQVQPRMWEDHSTGETVCGFIAEELFELGGEHLVSFSPWSREVTNNETNDEGAVIGPETTVVYPLIGNGTTPVTRDGNALSDDSEVVDGLNERGLVITLFQALQEAATEIESLKSRLDAAGV